MRKTYTSAEVKNRWNRQHYDRMQIIVPEGAGAEVKAAAERHGQSVSAYIRSLIIRDNDPEDVKNLRGGGVADDWENLKRAHAILAAMGTE